MTQILGTGEGKTSSAAKEPVVERKPAQVFFESMALAASMSGYYAGPTATTLGNSLSLGAGTAAGVGEGVAGARALAAPNPLTVALLAIFYSPSLNEGETETLQNIRGDQLYQNLIHGQMMVGAFTRVNSTVIEGDYVPEYELREIARQNGTVRTRVRFRIEEDPESGELVSRSYEVGEKSGLDRVRVRFAKQLNKETWGFEDPSIKGTFVWSRSAGQGKFEWGSSQTTVHDGGAGGRTTAHGYIWRNYYCDRHRNWRRVSARYSAGPLSARLGQTPGICDYRRYRRSTHHYRCSCNALPAQSVSGARCARTGGLFYHRGTGCTGYGARPNYCRCRGGNHRRVWRRFARYVL